MKFGQSIECNVKIIQAERLVQELFLLFNQYEVKTRGHELSFEIFW